MKANKRIFVGLVMILVLACMVACGKKEEKYRLIKVDSLTGTTTVEREENDDAMDAFEGMQLIDKDVVMVGDASELVLLMDSKKHMKADANTRFVLNATGTDKKGDIAIDMIDGKALFTIDEKINDESSFKVVTSNAVLSVRGTKFTVTYDAYNNVTKVEVEEGIVWTETTSGAVSEEVTAGETFYVVDDTIIPEDEYDDSADAGSSDDGSGQSVDAGSSGDYLWNNTMGGDEATIKTTYRNVVENMEAFLTANNIDIDQYTSYDYMYYDYDLDGSKEPILYLRYYDDNNTYMLDLVYLYYDEETDMVGVKAINRYDQDDACFYCDYNGRLARYSWSTNPYESYVYAIYVDGDKLTYVLEQSYDEILIDYESEGMVALPLYLHAGEYTDIGPFLED